MLRFLTVVVLLVPGCSEPTPLVTAPPDGTVVALPTATADAPFTIDDAMTLPVTQDQLVAAIRAEGFPVTDPKPERGYNVSTGGKLRGIMVAAGKNGDVASAEQNAKLLAVVSALATDGTRDEARDAVAASIVTAFGKGGDDPARVISYSNSKATVRVRPMPDRGLLFTITPNPERLLQVR